MAFVFLDNLSAQAGKQQELGNYRRKGVTFYPDRFYNSIQLFLTSVCILKGQKVDQAQ